MSLYISKKEFDNQFEKYMRNNEREFELIIKRTLEKLENANKKMNVAKINKRTALYKQINKCIEIYKKILKDYKGLYNYLLEISDTYKYLPIEKDYYVKEWYKYFKEKV